MKTALVVSTPDAKFSALAFKDELSASFRKVSGLGYNGIEISIRYPEKLDKSEIKQLMETYELEIPAIATGRLYGEEGLSLTNNNDSIREKTIERLKSYVDFASSIQSFVIIGLIRGKTSPEVNLKRAMDYIGEGLKLITDYGYKKGVSFIIEPINRYETDIINTVEEAIRLIDLTGSSNMGILADTFHMNIEEKSIYKTLKLGKDYILHVHAADSNRWAPGYGHLDFPRIIGLLDRIGYSGYLSAEILPEPNSEICARVAIKTLRTIINRIERRKQQ